MTTEIQFAIDTYCGAHKRVTEAMVREVEAHKQLLTVLTSQGIGNNEAYSIISLIGSGYRVEIVKPAVTPDAGRECTCERISNSFDQPNEWKLDPDCPLHGRALDAPPQPAAQPEQGVAAQIVHKLMELVDGSNWPAHRGDFYRGYSNAMETVGEVISDFQDAAYKEQKREAALVKAARELNALVERKGEAFHPLTLYDGWQNFVGALAAYTPAEPDFQRMTEEDLLRGLEGIVNAPATPEAKS